MDRLQNVFTLNNWGVSLLDSKNVVCAIHAFQSGVDAMRTFTGVDATTDDATMSHGASESVAPKDKNPLFSLQAGTKLDGLQQGAFYTYDRPLLLPADAQIPGSDMDSTILTASAVLIFNFGMACHQFGKQTGQEAAIRQAAQIYELILRMVNRTGLSEKLCNIFMCLALNNLANIHSEQCDYESCEQCLECMRDLFEYHEDIDQFALQFLNECEWTEIKLNLLFLRTPTTAQAA
jgi:hypothetical protein